MKVRKSMFTVMTDNNAGKNSFSDQSRSTSDMYAHNLRRRLLQSSARLFSSNNFTIEIVQSSSQTKGGDEDFDECSPFFPLKTSAVVETKTIHDVQTLREHIVVRYIFLTQRVSENN